MKSTKRYAVTLAIALTVLVGPALSGCSVQNLVQNATGGQVDIGGKSVPKDFPRDVPLAAGDVILGGSVGAGANKVWNVTISVTGASAFDDIATQLTGAGFAHEGVVGGSTAAGGTGTFQNDKFGVLVVVSKNGDKGWFVNYTVTTKSTK